MEKTLEQMTEELVKNGKVELPYIIIPEYDELKVLEKMFKRNHPIKSSSTHTDVRWFQSKLSSFHLNKNFVSLK